MRPHRHVVGSRERTWPSTCRPGLDLAGRAPSRRLTWKGREASEFSAPGGVLLSVCDLGGGASLLKASLLLTQSLSTFLPIQVISPAARTLLCSPRPATRAADRASTPLPRGLAPSWHRPSLSLAGLVPNVWLTPLSCRQGQLPASPVSQLRPRQDPLLYLTLREENTYSPACHLVPLNMEDS